MKGYSYKDTTSMNMGTRHIKMQPMVPVLIKLTGS